MGFIPKISNWKAAIAIVCVFLGCCSNVVFLELLVKYDPGSGNLITFSQFAFIALEGFIFTHRLGTQPARIGFKDYTILVAMFFTSSVCNNYAFDFNIPMPLHMIFRAGSLIANMIMGILILNKKYDFSKYFSVLLITFGIIICTIVSGSDVKESKSAAKEVEEEADPASVFFWWTLGITLLTVALFISARMGIYQEVLYKRYGKHPREALYYTHLLPLPGFLLLTNNIWDHFKIAVSSPPVQVPVLDIAVPIVVLFLLGNVLTQYVCISSVYVLTTECSSLTVTLVVTLRKFVSLLFSIIYFQNPFTIYHWIGTLCVFYGTIVFTEVIPNVRKSLATRKSQGKKVD
ncbi:UDP-xylose and UDP-N-acetylglucosamine transporter-like [Phlebotomus papatasi]|uniref:UDP-xylose and UDP-N-acetylglucosamine transporter-like n=1 Tax=Phlebotomus papatasi TaxID=29031 RepID=UPI0024838B8C|nr:UDP-xylose and UDP-N-acetylglucosamine transporter-like [Phlebotomus papatasi]